MRVCVHACARKHWVRFPFADISESTHTSDFKIGTPVATPLSAWRCRVSTGTGGPGVSILSLGEIESLLRNLSQRVRTCLSRSVPEIHQHVAGALSKHASQHAKQPNLLLGR